MMPPVGPIGSTMTAATVAGSSISITSPASVAQVTPQSG